MISPTDIYDWRAKVPWQTLAQIEQDLLISRALTDLYNNEHIKDALVFRGGTALNKLFINPPARYSEDIDFVQKNPEPIGKTINAIREALQPWLGDPKWKITQRSAKIIYKYESISKVPAKLKIEINTKEHLKVLPLKTVPFYVNSGWFEGSANIITHEIDELMATKLRALYQRRKGRDLFDIWYVAHHKLINLDRLFAIFFQYCSYNDIKITGEEFIKNLELKKDHVDFHLDMSLLLAPKLHWNFEEAYQFVIDEVISKLP